MRQEKQKDTHGKNTKELPQLITGQPWLSAKKHIHTLYSSLMSGCCISTTHLRDFTPQRTMRFAEKNMVALPSREERQKPHKKEEASKMKQDNHSNTTVQREKPSGTNTRLGSGVPVKNPTN